MIKAELESDQRDIEARIKYKSILFDTLDSDLRGLTFVGNHTTLLFIQLLREMRKEKA